MSENKPRKLEENTATYLVDIELQFQELVKGGEDTAEQRSILVENVLTEIQNRTASIATDRRTNFVLEKLCAEASLAQLLQILQKWEPYAVFLARNRYSSHVLQVIFSRIWYLFDINDEKMATEAERSILPYATVLLNDINWLSRELSSSHVLRSLICLLAGCPPIAEKKSKNSKHQHSVSNSVTLDSLYDSNHYYISQNTLKTVPKAFHETLMIGINNLINKKPRDTQELLAEISSCAVISLLCRFLANPAFFSTTIETSSESMSLSSEKLIAILENAFDVKNNIDRNTGTLLIPSPILFNMAGDQTGSYFLETVIESAPTPLLLSMIQLHFAGKLAEYCVHKVGNFIIQAVLRRVAAEFRVLTQEKNNNAPTTQKKKKSKHEESTDGNNHHNTIYTTLFETTKGLIEESMAGVSSTDNGDFTYSNSDILPALSERLLVTRPGVIAWIIELQQSIANYNNGDNTLGIFSDEVLGLKILRYWQYQQDSSSVSSTTNMTSLIAGNDARIIAEYLSKSFQIVATFADEEKDKNKPNNNKSSQPENKSNTPGITFSAQNMLARILSLFLQSTFPALKRSIANIIANLNTTALQNIASSGQLSKALLDTFFTQFSRTSMELKSLGQSLVVLAATLSCHRVGFHVVKKLYESSDLRGRERWVTSLLTSKPQLEKSKEGRNMLQLMHVGLYERDAADWRTNIKTELKTESFAEDLKHLGEDSANKVDNADGAEKKEKSKSKAAKNASSEETNDNIEPNVESVEKDEDGEDEENNNGGESNPGLKKRKRKRPNKAGKAVATAAA